jgi:hypothetical protein
VFSFNFLRGIGIIFLFANLVGCTNGGWVPYREAMNCHFQTPDKNCSVLYVEAIEENQALPGVHASYGAYLLSLGHKEQALIEFNQEIKNYPDSKTAVLLLANPKAKSDNTSTAQVNNSETDNREVQ